MIPAVGVFTQRPCSQVPLCAFHIPESQKDPGITSDLVSTPAPRSRGVGPGGTLLQEEAQGGIRGASVGLGPFLLFLGPPSQRVGGREAPLHLPGKMHDLSHPFVFSFFKTIFHMINRVGWVFVFVFVWPSRKAWAILVPQPGI